MPTVVDEEMFGVSNDGILGIERSIFLVIVAILKVGVVGCFLYLGCCCGRGSKNEEESKGEKEEEIKISRWPSLNEIEGGSITVESPIEIETPIMMKWGPTDVVGELTE